MLSPEQAQAILIKEQLSGGSQVREQRFKRLPPNLARLAGQIENEWRNSKTFAPDLEALAETERVTLFEALCPGLGQAIENGWGLFPRLPYQMGYTFRSPFRVPSLPEATRAKRVTWLNNLFRAAGNYNKDLEWYAAWAPYVAPFCGDAFGILFAAAIDQGGPAADRIFDILIASAKGEHEVGMFGRHVTRGLLSCSRVDGWDYVEKMLLAAQRQEGLRQTILESVDEAHPDAFRRMLRLMCEHQLTRFSSAIRAIDVWLGFQYEAMDQKVADRSIGIILACLDDQAVADRAIACGDGNDLYLALWTRGISDATLAIPPAAAVLQEAGVERRFAAAYFLAKLQLEAAARTLVPVLDDLDLRIAAAAFGGTVTFTPILGDLYEPYERLIGRLPSKTKEIDPIVWPWMKPAIDTESVAHGLLDSLGDRPVDVLIKHVPNMGQMDKLVLLKRLAKKGQWTGEARELLFTMAGDLSETVRNAAFLYLQSCRPETGEVIRLEALLKRKAEDLRRGAVTVLLAQDDPHAVASAERLIASKEDGQRTAGLEILRTLAQTNRDSVRCRRIAAEWRDRQPQISGAERTLLDFVEVNRLAAATLDNALGLSEPARRTPPTPPQKAKNWLGQAKDKAILETPAAVTCLKSLDNLIRAHQETPIASVHMSEPRPFGSLMFGVSQPTDRSKPEDLPLREIFEQWWRERPRELRDPDGFEMLRAEAYLISSGAFRYGVFYVQRTGGGKEFLYPHHIRGVVSWMSYLHPAPGTEDFLLDALESSWASQGPQITWLQVLRTHRNWAPHDWRARHHVRLFGLLRWYKEPPSGPRPNLLLREVLDAYSAGGATDDDIFDQILGSGNFEGTANTFRDLGDLSARKPAEMISKYPILAEVVDRCRKRIIDVEVTRGDLPTAATPAVRWLRYSGGLDSLVRLVAAFGAESFARGYAYGAVTSKSESFSRLIRITFPGPDDTPEAFTNAVNAAKIPEKRLVEVAVYAPQWARHVEHTLGWPMFREAVWWVHAHTKDPQWTVEPEIRNAWAAEVSSVTPLTSQELLDGAVDVTLFGCVTAALGPQRWRMVDDAAKLAATGSGHKRAQLFADAMLGGVDEKTLTERVVAKRHQDSVRALGLVALPLDPDARKAVVLRRYEVIQEFQRGAKQFGSQRQESEKLAASIGLQNLARTAGYPDPIRLEWAMEAEAVKDLAAGPVAVSAGGATVTLSIDEWGDPDIVVVKGGKELKTVPPAVKKDPAVANLFQRKSAIAAQGSRMRASLESAMCRGDEFDGIELRELMAHPVLRPMLRSLVLTAAGGETIGYPVDGGAALQSHDGSTVSLSPEGAVRIAHSHDLLVTGEWDRWQRECFLHVRVQPFKLVFRELFVLT
ncbi:MAG: DUF5724 domain-containing protein, partial [Capsulimonadaceae bacterium]